MRDLSQGLTSKPVILGSGWAMSGGLRHENLMHSGSPTAIAIILVDA